VLAYTRRISCFTYWIESIFPLIYKLFFSLSLMCACVYFVTFFNFRVCVSFSLAVCPCILLL
jgi:hypothetical protein